MLFVSILLPHINEADTIEKAIESCILGVQFFFYSFMQSILSLKHK